MNIKVINFHSSEADIRFIFHIIELFIILKNTYIVIENWLVKNRHKMEHKKQKILVVYRIE